jgi:hypothetical protein
MDQQNLELLKSKINSFSFDKFIIKNQIVVFLKLDGLDNKYKGEINQDELKHDFSVHISSVIGFSVNRIIYKNIYESNNNIVIIFSINYRESEKSNSDIISELEERLESDNVGIVIVDDLDVTITNNNTITVTEGDNTSIIGGDNSIYNGLIGSHINKELTLPLKIFNNETLPLGFSLY